MKTLGVSMIVKNESAMIEACLESVKDADEIVIVDTGSEDNTIELCKKYTDKVFTYTGCNDKEGYLADFSDARNHSIDKCTTDYILIIDADEVLESDIKGIKYVLNSGFMHKHTGMSFIVNTSTEELLSCRLIRNDPKIRYIYPFHNQVAFEGDTDIIRRQNYKSKFRIKSGFSPAHKIDPDRTLRMINYSLEINPDDARSLYYKGREYLTRRMQIKDPENDTDKERLIKWVNETIDIFEHMDRSAFSQLWTNEYADGLFCLANCYIDKLAITQDMGYWYGAVGAAVKCALVLPTNKAAHQLLEQLMMITPHGIPHMHGVKFWRECAARADNTDVAFLREVPNIIKKK